MRTVLLFTLLSAMAVGLAQEDPKVSTMDFVQVLNGNKAEALFYYVNNWKVLRENALEKGFIHSYQLLETPRGEGEPFELLLITTYKNQKEYERSEDRFDVLIAEKGPLHLMNGKKPGEFRKVLFSKLATQVF
ncbi:MAG: hypothetical protein Mars2KO_34130 [Maribacter sp.]